jgi:hypothetical protein
MYPSSKSQFGPLLSKIIENFQDLPKKTGFWGWVCPHVRDQVTRWSFDFHHEAVRKNIFL